MNGTRESPPDASGFLVPSAWLLGLTGVGVLNLAVAVTLVLFATFAPDAPTYPRLDACLGGIGALIVSLAAIPAFFVAARTPTRRAEFLGSAAFAVLVAWSPFFLAVGLFAALR